MKWVIFVLVLVVSGMTSKVRAVNFIGPPINCHQCGCGCTTDSSCTELECRRLPDDCSLPDACVLVPTVTPVEVKPTSAPGCSWCGDVCQNSKSGLKCDGNKMPPAGAECLTINGGCEVRKCDWCGSSCTMKDSTTKCSGVLPPGGKSCGFDETTKSCVVSDSKGSTCLQCQAGVVPKSEGNSANENGLCDNKVDILDFGAWRNEYVRFNDGEVMPKDGWISDFDCDEKVGILDFAKWRSGYVKYMNVAPTAIPTSCAMPVCAPKLGCSWVNNGNRCECGDLVCEPTETPTSIPEPTLELPSPTEGMMCEACNCGCITSGRCIRDNNQCLDSFQGCGIINGVCAPIIGNQQ